MRRASSRVSSLVARASAGLVLEIEIAEGLPGAVAHDEVGVVCLIERPGRLEAILRRRVAMAQLGLHVANGQGGYRSELGVGRQNSV